MYLGKAVVVAAVSLPTVLSSTVHQGGYHRARTLDQYGNDIGDVPIGNASTTIDSTISTSTLSSYSVPVQTLSSSVDSSNTTSTIVTDYSVSSASQTDSTEKLTTYTTLTTCPVTNTYVSDSSTRLETVLTTSTIVITSCQGGCSRFTIAIPTPSGNLYNVTLPSTTLSSVSSVALPSQNPSLQSDSSALLSLSSSIGYANGTTTPMVTISSDLTSSLPALTTISSSSYALLPFTNDATSPMSIYVSSQSSVANGSSPTLSTSILYSVNAPTASASSVVVPDIISLNLTLSLPRPSSAIQLSTGLSLAYSSHAMVTDRITPNATLSLTGPSILTPSVYGQSSLASMATQVLTPSSSYATTRSSAQVLSSGHALETAPFGTPNGSNGYASYPVITFSSSSSNLVQGTYVGMGSASNSTPQMLIYGSSTTTFNGRLGNGISASTMPTTAQAGSTSSGSTPTVSASTYSSVLLGTNTVDSLVPSALAYGVVMTSPTSGSITRPSYGLRSGSSTITSTVTVSPLPYGSRSSSYTVTSQSPIVGSPVVSPEIATSGTSGLDSVYGPSPSVPGSSIVPTSYTISPALVSSSSTISLAPGSYLLTTDIYGSPTALLFSPSVTSAIRGYLVAPVQGSSTSAGAMPGYTPVYTPEILGNAYGGGFVSTPTVYVSSTAGSGVNGIPPGYGFSILVVGSSTTTAYASGPSYVSTSLTNPTANGLHGYNSASTVSSSISGSITSLPSQSSQSGNPSTTPYNQGRSSSTAAGAGAANVAAVAPLSVNNGGSISSATSTAGAVRAVPSSTTSSKGNMTSSVSPTTPVIFTGDAVQGRVASLGFVLGLLLLIHML